MTPTLAAIKAAVVECYSVDLWPRSDTNIRPRQIAMYLAREMTELSPDEIGSAFDEDATGVREAVDSIDGLAWNDPVFANTLKELRMMVTGG